MISGEKKYLQGSISLLLAIFIFGVAVLGGVILNLADLRRTEHQLAVVAAEQAEAVLACYHRPLFEEYGILAYQEDVPDHLGQVFTADRIKGRVILEIEPGAEIRESISLTGQINDFMALRLPKRALKRLIMLSETFQTSEGKNAIDAMSNQEVEQATTLLEVWSKDENTEIETATEGVKKDPEETEEGAIKNENWTVEEAGLLNQWKREIKETVELQLAYSGAPSEAIPNPFDIQGVQQLLKQVDEWTSVEGSTLGNDIRLDQYVLGMFKSAPHSAEFEDAVRTSPYQYNLRHRDLALQERQLKGEVEYILMGSGNDYQNLLNTMSLVYGLRLMICLGDYRMSEEQWSHAQNLGALLSTVVSLISFGRINLPAETMTLIVWMVESGVRAFKDFWSLLKGKGVVLLPYSTSNSPLLYYQDYLGFLLKFVEHKIKLNRVCDLFEKYVGSVLRTGISVRLDWQAPVSSHLNRQIILEREYVHGQSQSDERLIPEVVEGVD